MLPHHSETIHRVTEHFRAEESVRGLLLAGSLAHGFATETSDVDVMIVVSNEEHEERLRSRRTCFFSKELCTYEGGYVDGKYVSEGFIQKVSSRGSEPARYAFQDAQLLFTRTDSLLGLVKQAAQYPVAEKESRVRRFQCQFQAWSWFTQEAFQRSNPYLLQTAANKLCLFGGRIVLAHNELLYPYHKWFLRVLESAPNKPAGLMAALTQVAEEPTKENIEPFDAMIREFREWTVDPIGWGADFMAESELSWLEGSPPVDDI